jgi:hypothetical protein
MCGYRTLAGNLYAADDDRRAVDLDAGASRTDCATVDERTQNGAVEDAEAGLGDDGADVDDVTGKCCDRECAVDLGAADRNTARSSGNRALVVDVADKRLDVLEENAVKGGRQRSVVFDVA